MAIPLANPPLKSRSTLESVEPQTWQAPAPLRLWHLSSLDAPSVAVVWAFAFAWAGRVRLEPWLGLMLFCGTWAVYIGDRLFDAARAMRTRKVKLLRDRHYFHWRHRRVFIALMVCLVVTASALIGRLMPAVARERNSLIGAVALAYFSGVHSSARLPAWLRRFGSKELLVGLIFTAGCAAPSFWRMHLPRWPMLICVSFFAGVAWLNCNAIDAWESRVPANRVAFGSIALAVLGFFASIGIARFDLRVSAALMTGAASAALLGGLDYARRYMDSLAVRIFADAVLLTPAILTAVGAVRG